MRAPRPRWPRAEANLAQASALAERYKPLVEANAISKQDFANAVAAQKQAKLMWPWARPP
jgi:multidrug resistance efflux pump